MKLIYFASARIPGEKARSYQIMKMCEAFANYNVKVNLTLAFRLQTNVKLKQVKDVWSYYGIEKRFKITKLPSLDLVYFDVFTTRFSRLRFLTRQVSFAFSTLAYVLFKKADVYYARDFHALLALGFLRKKKVFYESHKFEPSVISLMKKGTVDGLIVITNRLKEIYLKEGVPKERILVAPDAVDLKMFDNPISKEAARGELEIPLDKKVGCYTGHLFEWKGAHILAMSMKSLSDQYIACFVGGTEEDIAEFRKFIKQNEIPNPAIVGHVPPTIVPKYLAAADVLVLPNIKKGLFEYTSPLKLFEYMASGRPIVASDLPSIREILSEENAVLVEPGNPEALAEGIKRVLDDKELANKISQKAREDIIQYTWHNRAKMILKFIGGGGE